MTSQVNRQAPELRPFKGDYYQTSSAGSGALNIDIGGYTGGSSFDQLNISGLAVLGGTLDVTLINGFVPNVSDSFTIMTYGSHVGEFQTVTGLEFNGNTERFNIQYNSTNVTLVVVSDSSTSAPTVTGVSPTSGSTAGGTSVTITGTNFVDVYDVAFGSVPAISFTVNSTTSITPVVALRSRTLPAFGGPGIVDSHRSKYAGRL